ncbi:MAG: aminopeptidase [Candidatus Aenigmarchaeota archaeon]|nr:aminopeptidase [Candidatus Aenigmarchaeota archaeon]
MPQKDIVYESLPKYVKIIYDDTGKPIGVEPTDVPQEAHAVHLSNEDKMQVWEWLSTLNKNIITLRNELSKSQVSETKTTIREEHPAKPTEISEFLKYTNDNINKLRQELQKEIVPTDQVLRELVTKADMAELIQTLKMTLSKQKIRTGREILIDKSVFSRILKESLRMIPGEKIIIISDKPNMRYAKMFYKEATELSSKVYMIITEKMSRHGQEPDESVANSLSGASIIIAITSSSLAYTDAIHKSLLAGARFLSIPSFSSESLKNGAIAPYLQISTLVQKVYSSLKPVTKIKVTSGNGTDVSFSVEGRRWHAEDGLIGRGKWANFPAGEVFIAPVETSVNGRIVFDHCRLTKPPAEFHVQNGLIKKTKGRVIKLSKYFKEIGEKARTVGEFGIGCNPKASFLGSFEDRKVLGAVHFGFGSNYNIGGIIKIPFHEDGVIEKPNVFVDGKLIIREGKLIG